MSDASSLLPLKIEDIPLATGKIVYITGVEKALPLNENSLTRIGGGSGIGLACAKLFAKKGAKGVVIADYKKPQPEVLQQLPSNVLFVHTDVSSWPSMVASFDACIEKFSTVDYVFANAGIGELEHLFEDHFGKDGELLGMEYTAIDVKYDAQGPRR